MCFSNKRLTFLAITILTFFTSCDNSNPPMVTPLPREPHFNNECTGMPNCTDKQGLELKWEPGTTEVIVQRKEFLSQIPIDYTGHIKLCGENGLYRYIECKNGKVDGISICYDCDGGYDEQYYKNSIAEGTWIHYNKSENYDFVRNFKNGLLHGELILYGDNLEIQRKENYRNGELHGESKSFYPNGEVEKYSEYNNGKELLSEEFYESGQLKSKKIINGKELLSEEFYESGQLKSKKIIKNLIIEVWVDYDKSGNIIFEKKKRPPININRLSY